jgi:hypothetical protein
MAISPHCSFCDDDKAPLVTVDAGSSPPRICQKCASDAISIFSHLQSRETVTPLRHNPTLVFLAKE